MKQFMTSKDACVSSLASSYGDGTKLSNFLQYISIICTILVYSRVTDEINRYIHEI